MKKLILIGLMAMSVIVLTVTNCAHAAQAIVLHFHSPYTPAGALIVGEDNEKFVDHEYVYLTYAQQVSETDWDIKAFIGYSNGYFVQGIPRRIEADTTEFVVNCKDMSGHILSEDYILPRLNGPGAFVYHVSHYQDFKNGSDIQRVQLAANYVCSHR